MAITPEEIKTIRNNLGMTQAQFARRMRVDFITISRWERGKQKPRISVEKRLRRLDGRSQ